MPLTGLCSDVTCDKEIKQLYECHCCSCLICFNHLTEHIEITRRNNERLDNLNHELIIVTATLKLMIEKKLLVIEHEKKLIEQAEKLFDGRICSIDEMQNILGQINQTIASNSIEPVMKIESSLLDMRTSSIHKCDVNEKNSQNEQSSVKNLPSESKYTFCLDLNDNIDEVEKSIASNDGEDSMCDDDEFTDNTLLDQTAASMKDEREKQNKLKRKETTAFIGLCPLTFDGAYGFTKAKHFIHLCSNKKLRRTRLYVHLMNKHKLKAIYARRLVQAVANDQNPMTTKIFHGNTNVINHSHKIPCPFNNQMLDLSQYTKKIFARDPCGVQSMTIRRLKFHLKRYHHISARLTEKIVNHLANT